MKRDTAPLVSLGQGDYRRDLDADDFRIAPLWLLIVGLALGVCAAFVIDSISGARADDTRTTAQMASAGLSAPEPLHAR